MADSIRILPLRPEQDADWDAYVRQHGGGSPYHETFFRNVLRDVSRQTPHYRLAVDGDGETRGVLPLVELRSWLFGHYLVSLPWVTFSGPLADDPAIAVRLMEEAADIGDRLGVDHVQIRDTVAHDVDWQVAQTKVNMQLGLPDSEEALWKQLGGKLRAQIRRPQKEGAEARSGGAELIDDFHAVYARNMRDMGMPAQPKRLFQAIASAYPDALVIVVYLNSQPVAAGFLLGGYQRLDIPWASSLREFNRYSVNMLLYWEALQQAVQRGCRTFEFGRSTPGEGTYRFKRQWGAEPVPLHWHNPIGNDRDPPQPDSQGRAMGLAIAAWKRLPLSVTGWLGPRLIRCVP